MGEVKIKTTPKGYRQFWLDGKRLPSPSSIVGRFKDSGGLIYWANQQGLEGKTLDDAREEVTTPGSIVHDRIECDIRGHDWDQLAWAGRLEREGLDHDEIWGRVENGWGAYWDWRKMTKLEPVAAEVSLTSERYRFGGTMDAIQVLDGLYLFDWKTGGLYPDHLVQLGGYIVLWEENFPDQPIKGAALVSINKEHGGFAHHQWPRDVMQENVDQFLRFRECYESDKRIKKLL